MEKKKEDIIQPLKCDTTLHEDYVKHVSWLLMWQFK